MMTRTFTYAQWHAWEASAGRILLSEETTKQLRSFASWDDVVNFLFAVASERDAARELNRELTAWRKP